MASRPFWQTRRQTPSASRLGLGKDTASQDVTDPKIAARSNFKVSVSEKTSKSERENATSIVKEVLAECKIFQAQSQPEGPPQADGFIGLFIEVCRWQADWRSENARRRGSKSPFAGRISDQRHLDTMKIGEGTTFNVYRRYDNGAELGREPKFVVMKDPKLSFEKNGAAKDTSVMKGIQAEIRVLSEESIRKHKNIVRLLDIRWDNPNLDRENIGPTLYLEYSELGTLAQFFKSGNSAQIEASVTQHILIGVWDGLDALHRSDIIHGDIKPSNMLLSQEGDTIVAKVSDFGCAMFIADIRAERVELTGRSPPWDAPEAGSEIAKPLLKKTDIYSYGLLYWWVQLSGQDPFSIDCVSEETNSTFRFTGPRENRLDALKKLKQTEDLDDRMLLSVMSAQSEKVILQPEFLDEVTLIGSMTLKTKPEERKLGSSNHPFTHRPAEYTVSDGSESSSRRSQLWTPKSSLTLPLRRDTDERIPLRRLVQVLKILTSDHCTSTSLNVDVKLLLFRCNLEGLGVPQNLNLAARHLHDAANMGHPIAQAMVKRFCEMVGYEDLPDQGIQYCLGAFLSGESGSFVEVSMNPIMYEVAMEARLSTILTTTTMPSKEELLHNLNLSPSAQTWSGVQTTPLHFVATCGWLDIMQTHLQHLDPSDRGLQLDLHDKDGFTPLMSACKYGQFCMAALLLDLCPTSGVQPGDLAPPPLFLLAELGPRTLEKRTRLEEVVRKMVRAGVDPNQVAGIDLRERMILGELGSLGEEEIVWDNLRDPLSYAIWVGDIELVVSLLAVGAVPDRSCLHLASASHRHDILDVLFSVESHAWPTIEQCNVGSMSLLDSALQDSPLFGCCKRLSETRAMHEASLKSTIKYLLKRCSGHSHLMKPQKMLSYLRQLCRFGVADSELLEMLIYPNAHGSYEKPGVEFLFTAIVWDQLAIANYLLEIGCRSQNLDGFGASHTCAITPVTSEVYQHLQTQGIDFGLKQSNRAQTDLETPLQMAVAHQNFPIASWLFESGLSRDDVIPCSTNRQEDCTLLGWLLRRNWSENSNSIVHLLDEYVDTPLPDFIVTPRVGRSALQEAARSTPTSRLGEQDAREQMQCLVLKYPGTRHLDYQRIDRAGDVRGDTQHAGLINVIVNGRPTVVKNSYHFAKHTIEYPETKFKDDNGTALHFAVRNVNLPAVEVLLEAGADGSAMIGLALPDTFAVTRKPASTYAVKENCWASTVLDFAMLVADRLEIESVTMASESVSRDLRAKHQYQEQRIGDIVKLLQKSGAANSATFIGKRGEDRVYRLRREKGNRAAFRMFKKELKAGLATGLQVYKETKKELTEQFSAPSFTPEASKINFANNLLRGCRFDEALKLYLEIQRAFQQRRFYEGESDYWLLVQNIAVTLSAQGKHVEAAVEYKVAIAGLETCLGSENITTLTAKHNLGVCFLNQDKIEEAEVMCDAAYNGRKKLLGAKNQDTLEALASVGIVRMRQDRDVEAEVAFQQALHDLESQPDSSEPLKLRVMYNIGLLYKKIRNLDDAKNILEKTVARRESALGVQHTDTLHAAAQLSFTLKALGETEGAINYGARALIGFLEIYTVDDTNVTDLAFAIGEIYRDLQQWDEAVVKYQLALQGEDKRLGRNNLSTLSTVTRLASTCKLQGQTRLAIEMELRALGGYQENFEHDDINVTNTAYRLGELYSMSQEWDKSSSVYRLALRGEESRLGPDHTDTLLTVAKLAANYTSQGSYSKAAELEERVLRAYQKQLPFDDEKVTNAAYRLGKAYANMKQWVSSISAFETALSGEVNRLGSDDEATLMTMRQLALAYTSHGSPEHAISLRVRVLDSMRKATMIDDRTFLDTHWNLAWNYKSTSPDLSFSHFKVATEGYEILLGPNHKETLEGYSTLGEVSRRLGNTNSAEFYLRKAVDGYTQTLGTDHEDTLKSTEHLAGILGETSKSAEGEGSQEYNLASKRRNSDPDHTESISISKNVEQIDSIYDGQDRAQRTRSVDQLGAVASWSADHAPEPSFSTSQPITVTLSQAVPVDNLFVAAEEPTDAWINRIVTGSPTRRPGKAWELGSIWSIITEGLSTETIDCQGRTPLLWAAENGPLEAVQLLLNMEADVSKSGLNGQTALHVASRYNHEDIVCQLLSKGASVIDKDADGMTAIHHAAKNGHTSILETLCKSLETTEEEYLTYLNKDGNSPLHLACDTGHVDATQFLLGRGSDVCRSDGLGGFTPVLLSAKGGHTEVLKILLDAGGNTEDVSHTGMTALHYATFIGNAEMVQLLLEYGANIEAIYIANDWTPLVIAINEGHTDSVVILVQCGAQIAVKDTEGRTPLHMAAGRGRNDIVALLIEEGAATHAKDEQQLLPLHHAALNGDPETVKILLSSDPKTVQIKERNGCTPLHLAAFRGHTEVVLLSLNGGAEVNSCDSSGLTPLHHAARSGKIDTIRVLLDSGADASIESNEGKKAVDYASQGLHFAAALLLSVALQSS